MVRKHPNTYVRRILQDKIRANKNLIKLMQHEMSQLFTCGFKDDNYVIILYKKDISNTHKELNELKRYFKYYLDQKNECNKPVSR